MATICATAQINERFGNDIPNKCFTNSSTELILSTSASCYTRNNSVLLNATTFFIPILLYPIPRRGGKSQIDMEDVTAVYEIIVNDFKGNVVRVYPGFKGSRLVITGLKKGYYLVRIKNLFTKKIITEKLIMKE